ncbi:hypothetical protein TKK_0015238 [Trichogramma kaykai]|uniref:Leucine-rich repeat-containing protein 27 n=1 Tax=Trichogramma kaykai TaxID=54128 RepID=A0ABD2WCM2_9HYME
MSENIHLSLLSRYYGLKKDENGEHRSVVLTSSKAVEKFQIAHDEDGPTTGHLISTEETNDNENSEDEPEKINQEIEDFVLPKSPHILNVEDLELEINAAEPESTSPEVDIVVDLEEEKKVPVSKPLPRLEDTLARALSRIIELPLSAGMVRLAGNNPVCPATKAKKLWRQKTIQSRENLLAPPNLLSKFNGTYLDLNNFGIPIFPLNILPQITSLQILYLDNNNLTELPEELFIILKHLKWLDIRNNQLWNIPTTIKGHACLETLLIQGNNIERLPCELGLVPNLTNLQTANNPIVFPPKEILDLDCASIVNFLRTEWNKENPNQRIELRTISNEKLVTKKPSTIICYQPTVKKLKEKKLKYSQSDSPKTSVRAKQWNYKPSDRCPSNRSRHISLQKVLWMEEAKKILSQQSKFLQKSIDKKVLNHWRYQKRFKRPRKESKYSLEAPFSLDVDKPKVQSQNKKTSDFIYLDDCHFNEEFEKMVDLFKNLTKEDSSDNMTPRTEQKHLQSKMKKIRNLQSKLENIKFYNDSVHAELDKNKDKDDCKKHIRPPSIII